MTARLPRRPSRGLLLLACLLGLVLLVQGLDALGAGDLVLAAVYLMAGPARP